MFLASCSPWPYPLPHLPCRWRYGKHLEKPCRGTQAWRGCSHTKRYAPPGEVVFENGWTYYHQTKSYIEFELIPILDAWHNGEFKASSGKIAFHTSLNFSETNSWTPSPVHMVPTRRVPVPLYFDLRLAAMFRRPSCSSWNDVSFKALAMKGSTLERASGWDMTLKTFSPMFLIIITLTQIWLW